jgi:hypothetical protein
MFHNLLFLALYYRSIACFGRFMRSFEASALYTVASFVYAPVVAVDLSALERDSMSKHRSLKFRTLKVERKRGRIQFCRFLMRLMATYVAAIAIVDRARKGALQALSQLIFHSKALA